MIKRVAHVVISYDEKDPNRFYNAMAENINEMQDQNLKVEVQYQMSSANSKESIIFSALLLGSEFAK